ncbi:hypothetical protein J2S21_004214 [Peribacillus cavernae]|nr:hypothetical protein [Peribacillus cavernae]
MGICERKDNDRDSSVIEGIIPDHENKLKKLLQNHTKTITLTVY